MSPDISLAATGETRVIKRLLAPYVPALLMALLSVSPAYADVLEINSNGYSWVAGGPAEVVPQAAPAAPSHPATTLARDTAGPAFWAGYVRAVAAKYDLSPALLEALIWQESRWNINATSPVGAHGLTQLMPGTARQLGVNPRDPIANLEGGARYLRMQLDQFGGDVEKALAAYNAGPARVARAGGIPAIRETREYVAAIMARLATPVRR